MMNQYELELKKADLMIGIWQEINRFSNRVLTLQRNHRSAICSMMQPDGSKSIAANNKTISISKNIHNHNHNHNNIRPLNGLNGHSAAAAADGTDSATNTLSINVSNREHKKRRRQYRFSTGNDTSSESDSDSEPDSDGDSDDNLSSKSDMDDMDDMDNEAEAEADDVKLKNNSDEHINFAMAIANDLNNGSDRDRAHSRESNGSKSSAKSKKKERKTTKGRCSGYNIYFGVRCKEIQKMDPNLEFASISRNIGNEWKNLAKFEQTKWNHIAAKTTQQRKEDAERKERQQKQLKQDKKRKLAELNGYNENSLNGMHGHGQGLNGFVSNVRIDNSNGLNTMSLNGNTVNALQLKALNGGGGNHGGDRGVIVGPPPKKMRLDLQKFDMNNMGVAARNMGASLSGKLLNSVHSMNTNHMKGISNLPMFNRAAVPVPVPKMSSPPLSLLSEAIKKMPALQAAPNTNITHQ